MIENRSEAYHGYDEAYHTGYEAHEEGEARSACPYPRGTWDADEWFHGWADAAAADLPGNEDDTEQG